MNCNNCASYQQIIANKDELIMKMQKDLEQIRDLANPHIYLKKERSKSRICLHYQEYGIRKNCKKSFVLNRIDKMHCSDGCRDTYNAKQRKPKDAD